MFVLSVQEHLLNNLCYTQSFCSLSLFLVHFHQLRWYINDISTLPLQGPDCELSPLWASALDSKHFWSYTGGEKGGQMRTKKRCQFCFEAKEGKHLKAWKFLKKKKNFRLVLVEKISCAMNCIHSIWMKPFYFNNVFYNTLILECVIVFQ